MAVRATPGKATIADLAAIADHDRLEIVNGAIIEKAAPSPAHATTEFHLGAILGPFARRSGGSHPGGWWLMSEVHTAYEGEVYCHDVAGWRRDRVAERPATWPVKVRPDWVCEIASPNHEKRDFVDKHGTLHRAGVPHYWILHPEQRMLIVYRWGEAGFVTILTATTGQRVRAEPFDAIEIEVGMLFGDDPADDQ